MKYILHYWKSCKNLAGKQLADVEFTASGPNIKSCIRKYQSHMADWPEDRFRVRALYVQLPGIGGRYIKVEQFIQEVLDLAQEILK